MARTRLYDEGWKQLNAIIPGSVKDRLEVVAKREGQSVSQIVTRILKEHLPEQEREPEAVGV